MKTLLMCALVGVLFGLCLAAGAGIGLSGM